MEDMLLSEDAPELSGVVAESSEEMQKAMEDGKSTYDMFASAMEGLVTINVVYEDLGALYGKLLDEAGLEEKGEAPKAPECTADLNVTANVDKAYVSRGEERMDLYRRRLTP